MWDQEIESAGRKKLDEVKLERLQQTAARVYKNVPYYREQMEVSSIKPEDIKSLADIKLLPFTTKEDLRVNYPFGLFAVPLQKIVRLHASSGTTGKPTVVGYTRGDLETWTELVARVVRMAGAANTDVAQIAFGYGLFTGAFGLHYGLERIGAAVIPASGGNTERQVMLMKDFQTTVLISTPSYALYMAEVCTRMGIRQEDLALRLGLFGAEACTEEMRLEIEKRWNIMATDNYGLSEVMGPGVSGECIYRDGLHLAEDHFIPEIIDPETGENLDFGEEGELVLTPLTKEGLPLLRYRTKDITSLNPERCRCGRTLVRMRKVTGRTDDMLVIRGVNVYPSQIESILMEIAGVEPHYQIVVSRRDFLDQIEVRVEVSPARFTDRYGELEKLEKIISEKLESTLNLKARIRLVEPMSLERTSGKARRVIDLRRQ